MDRRPINCLSGSNGPDTCSAGGRLGGYTKAGCITIYQGNPAVAFRERVLGESIEEET